LSVAEQQLQNGILELLLGMVSSTLFALKMSSMG
jgi:hypothetical protein